MNDLHVAPVSTSLTNRNIDLIVTGSIGAVESVRFVRALRRLGADVRVWLTAGGAQFTTTTALEWASTQPVQQSFSGSVSHLAERDLCIVAPASANFIRKLAQGITDTPTAALAASYLGGKKPVFVLPNMHASLERSPAIHENLERIRSWCTVLEPRAEEGKLKFPDPATLADRISHLFNYNSKSVMIGFGGTKAFIDDVRYLANYSSGALGTKVAEELYRQGCDTILLRGVHQFSPSSYTKLIEAETYEAMYYAATETSNAGVDGIVFMASILDYVPQQKIVGKTRSGHEHLTVDLVPTKKILPAIQARSGAKVGFKLESQLDHQNLKSLVNRYFETNDLSLFVVNQLSDVSASQHRAMVYNNPETAPLAIEGKDALSSQISSHVLNKLLPTKGTS